LYAKRLRNLRRFFMRIIQAIVLKEIIMWVEDDLVIGKELMKKPPIQMKHPSTSPLNKPQTKKAETEPLPEGYIQEPHADYGLLNDEIDPDNVKK